ncbi:MAG: T9SS type A sorting domain-containing protein, partial [Bacteroidia bacterium]
SFYTYPDSGNVTGSSEEFELVLHGFIVNQNAADSNFTWKRITNNLQTNWEASICDKVTCWSPQVHTNTFVIPQGDSSILDAHFYLNNTIGNGHIQIAVWSGNDSANADTIDYFASTWALFAAKVGNDKTVKIYPNPTKGQLNLDFESTGTVEVEIFDVLGKKMRSFSHEGEHSSMDLSDLPNGLYIIRISENGEVYSRTFRKAN